MQSRTLERWLGRHGKNVVVLSIFFSLILSWTLAMALTNSNDVKVLNKLKRTWGGMTSLWGSGSDPCFDQWLGVNCDHTNSSVTSLVLVSADLVGGLPADIGSLHALRTLDLSMNNLAGTLPVELGNLKNLEALSLQKCGFTGPIPGSISNLTSLEFLALSDNNLSGSIPSSLGALSRMWWLDLSSNNLNGSIPVSSTSRDGYGLDMLRVNRHFHLNNNSLSGQLPPELGNATYALHMLLENNAFTGPIPDSFGNLLNLTILSLSNNQLTEKIPTSLNRITQQGNTSRLGLRQLLVAKNFLTGSVPNFSNLSQLEIVDFSNNKFDPQYFPAWLSQSQNRLQTIMMNYGNLIGSIPADVLAYPSLQSLSLRGNALNGTLTIPANLSVSLEVVSLQDNEITYIGQPSISNQSRVQQLQLELGNNTICKSPNIISKPNATICNTTDTTFGDWKPSTQSKNSCGAVYCASPLAFNAANCSCAAPLEIGLQIRNPMFSVIDDSLMDSLKSQTAQSLGLRREQVLVYKAYFTPSRRVEVWMNIFPNDSSKNLDQATQNNITASFTMQKVIYDPTFIPYLILVIENPAGLSTRFSRKVIIGIVFGIMIAGLFIIALCTVAFIQKRRADRAEEMSRPFASWGGDGVDNGEAPKLKGAQQFTFNDLKKATLNFSEHNEIGAGGYGKVYKGILHMSGEVVAVKRARKDSMQGAREFKTEIELLSRVHHINLVGLVGFCYEQGEQMLVYEYLPNGTLTDWLLGQRDDRPLDWRRRALIALGSARGLAYLHSLANPPIIHRDVKSSNILLDDNLVAKVADFGLSKLAPDAGQELETEVKGTLGYLDPEYYMSRSLSPKSDVYSFGVVMLELLSGRPPIHRGKYIVREVKIALDKGGIPALRPLLDPKIVGHIPAQDLTHFLELSLSCVEERGTERPAMNDVVKELESIVGPTEFGSGTMSGYDYEDWYQSRLRGDVSGDQEMVEIEQPQSDVQFQYSGFYVPNRIQPK